jgi:hypothetical protein
MIIVFFPWLVLLIMQGSMPTTHLCTLLSGFHESYAMLTTLGVYRPNCHGLTTLNPRGFGHEFGTLSFGGFTTSSVHYITGALATTFGCTEFSEVTMVVSQEGNLKPALAATVPWVQVP